jgi:hypothetical protein
MKDYVIGILVIIFISIVLIGSSFYRLYKDFDKMEPSDPLNDDFDEHTDQFII